MTMRVVIDDVEEDDEPVHTTVTSHITNATTHVSITATVQEVSHSTS